ncbi:plastocyanin/azurin family copper-binding protein [Nitrosopumilus sp. b2]|uniref:cupredoxin domain-containing protein n=1 Tax=Nitrosopumilus sp. b2 TaxID=2109908 RepID=UPI0015F6D3E4|nr:plastocyanin/azurin family copper-binding protein [Nitrosopumilus sp. b2]KAF6245653.1 hypothetical protein C6989_00470 [Nitrosopumilus sp. b2]
MKKITTLYIIGIITIVALVVAFSTDVDPQPEPVPESTADSVPEIFQSESEIQGDVVMPTKVSRPGCEKEDKCYIPSIITISVGESVTWVNEDSAFHSVTSGFYDAPIDLFDSGYLDPFEAYTLTFDESGTFDYFCTLHPWMEGQVIVE